MKIQIPDDARFILEQLEKNGYEAYVVGGCVRDSLLGRTPQDWDITTSAKPKQVKAVFGHTIDTGIQHGTVTVMLHRIGYEVTTYRIDGEYEDGRHPKSVAYTPDLRLDLERRDFTINAMAYHPQKGLIDIFEGTKDLRRGVISCVGEARTRFEEDALRMLRAVRFSGQLAFSIEEKTAQAIRIQASALKKVSAERIRVEWSKLLISIESGKIRDAWHLGLTMQFLPELDQVMEWDQKNPHHVYTVGEHSIQALEKMNQYFYQTQKQSTQIQNLMQHIDRKQHLILCLTMLLHDMAKPERMVVDENGIGHFAGHPEAGAKKAKEILHRMTYDNMTIQTVCRLIRYHDYWIEDDERAVRRAVSKIGADIIWMKFLVEYADISAQNPELAPAKLEKLDGVCQIYQKIFDAKEALTISALAVNGADLIEAGIAPGPQLGQVLSALLDIVLEEPSKNTKEYLMLQVQACHSQINELK